MVRQIIPVSVLADQVKQTIECADELADVWVDGEITGTSPKRSGHLYMTLRDEEAQMPVVMWKSLVARQAYLPGEGDQVTVHGRTEFYVPFGKLQLIIDVIQPAGQGLRQLELERLRLKLEAEGLFEPSRKRDIPRFPKRIGVVSSATGAVWHDIQTVIARRYPMVDLILATSAVQGEAAVGELVRAIQHLNALGNIDTIILARGGGSFEDLNSFNDEGLLRAIHASVAPVISAIGHETDSTLSDLVADLRAPTPSAAAELAVPDLEAIQGFVDASLARLITSIDWHLESEQRRLTGLTDRLFRLSPVINLGRLRQGLEALRARLEISVIRDLDQARFDLVRASAVLEALSPHAMLQRGYTFLTDAATGMPIHSVNDVSAGQTVENALHDGSFSSDVSERRSHSESFTGRTRR